MTLWLEMLFKMDVHISFYFLQITICCKICNKSDIFWLHRNFIFCLKDFFCFGDTGTFWMVKFQYKTKKTCVNVNVMCSFYHTILSLEIWSVLKQVSLYQAAFKVSWQPIIFDLMYGLITTKKTCDVTCIQP